MSVDPADPTSDAAVAGLDPEQAAAVTAPLGPVRILAGAGTGKTRAITHRIAHQVRAGLVPADQVLAVTHSARAAGEMRDRLTTLGVPGVQARTFHSAAMRQLAYFWGRTGLPGSGPVLVNSLPGGRYGMLRTALAETLGVRNGDVDSTDVLDLDGEITWARARRHSPKAYAKAARRAGRDRTQPAEVLGAAYAKYTAAKQARLVLDFEDLLSECARTIEEDPEVAAAIREQYSVFVVDEYQDTDPAQQRLLDAWLGDRDTLTVVGDPFQNIYGFKGAESSLLHGFTDRFPHAVSVSLVRDYRSTPQIVAAANRLMSGVRSRGAGLTLEGQQPAGPKPVVRTYEDEDAEEAGIARRVRDLIDSGVPGQEIAVLHRFNSQNVRLQAALRNAGVQVTVGENDKFFDRPEVVRAVTDLSHWDPDDDGRTALLAALTLQGHDPDSPPAGQGAALARWDALNTLVGLLEVMPESARATVAGLLADLRRRRAEEHTPKQAGTVTVSTIHKAKGLEWDVVLLARMTEGSLPSAYAKSGPELEEERRLAYVAITRGRKIVEATHAKRRGDGSGWKMTASPFLAAFTPRPRGGAGRKQQPSPSAGSVPQRRVVTAPAGGWRPGVRVVHDQHGMGTVAGVEGGRLLVDFGDGRSRPVQLDDTKLETL